MTDGSTDATLTLTVYSRSDLAEDIVLFDLRATSEDSLPGFEPGAHITVTTPAGHKRRYSLCNPASERHRYLIAVKHERNGRGGSASMVADVRLGDAIHVDPPGNEFAMSRVEPKSYIFIAGGIGITPIRSMIAHLLEQGRVNFRLFYFTRTPAMMAFRDEFEGSAFSGNVVLHHDNGDPDDAFDLWPVLEEQRGAHLYCCGPKGLMDAVRDMTGHWSDIATHFEDFVGAGAPRADDTAFSIRLAKTGRCLEVDAGSTILDTLRRNGHTLPSSCESGTCGTCRIRYLDGVPDHRDLVLSDPERRREIIACVSRAMTPELTLDL